MRVPLEKIIYDVDNPRIYHEKKKNMSMKGTELTQKQCSGLIWEISNIANLAGLIKEAGGLTDKPDIQKVGDIFVVIEGNISSDASHVDIIIYTTHIRS